MGQNDDIGQLKPIRCTIAACEQRFDTVKEMKKHKRYDPDHFYCKKCDVDCADWEALTQHKVDAMKPWLQGRMPDPEVESPKHIVCEFCGEDFKSFGGRKLHRQQYHAAKQNIVCPGCNSIFFQAGLMIAHLERGECETITRQQFLGKVQQKQIVQEIMKDPDRFQESLRENAESKQVLLSPMSDVGDVEDGGVDLLGYDDEYQQRSVEPMRTDRDLADLSKRLEATNTWPFLPGQESKGKGTSPQYPTPPDSDKDNTAPSESDGPSQATSRRGANKVYTESYPSLNSPTPSTTVTARPRVWATGATTTTLFPGAQPTPPPAGDWDAILTQRRERATASTSTNAFHSRFWDPQSKDYDATIFYNADLAQYTCPFASCATVAYDELSDLEGHLRLAHLKDHYTCPQCLKRFQTASALISHSEAPAGRCRVRESVKYQKLLDEVSGGFLKAEHMRAPMVASGRALGGDGGIMTTRFEAQMPGER